MAEQSKRASQLPNGDDRGHSGKKARARGMTSSGVVKQETEADEEEEEGEVREVSDDDAGSLVPTTEAMGEPQISLRFGLTLFHCRACFRPLKPPTFKCEAGHVVCFACRTSHGQACAAGAAYVPCAEVDAFVRDAKQPCAFEEFGCRSSVVYHTAEEHHRACPWAPCPCPSPGCAFFTAPARLLDHFAAAHAWPVTAVSYGKPHALAVPPPGGWHALVGEEDRRVFLVYASAVGAAVVVALVCVRANGVATEGADQYRCKLWAEVASNRDNMTMMIGMVASSNMSGGLPPAAEQSMFLAVPADILHDVSGDAPLLMVRIDRIVAATAAVKAATPPARSARRQQ